jgi:ATPase subunit of ABC transporter with duplicated ATPase domains
MTEQSVPLDDVHKSYPERELLRGVSLVVDENTRIGIVGANGSGGVSTLMRMLAGVVPDNAGQRRVRADLRDAQSTSCAVRNIAFSRATKKF